MTKHGDKYHWLKDSTAAKRQREYYEAQYPELYAKWLAFPGRKERRRALALARRAAK
jgi:hypothetical protein